MTMRKILVLALLLMPISLAAQFNNPTTINGAGPGNFNFTGAVTCTGLTCNFTGGGGSGTVTSVAMSATIAPYMTCTVSSPTAAASIACTVSTAAANTVLAGPTSGGSAAPTFQTAPTISAANMTNFPTFNQNTTGNASTSTTSQQTQFPATASTGGTTANLLVSYDGTTGNVTTTPLGAKTALGIASATATSGNPLLVGDDGLFTCVADNTITVGDLLGTGTVTAGRCSDLGVTGGGAVASNVQIVGRAVTSATAGGTFTIQTVGAGHFGTNSIPNIAGGAANTWPIQTAANTTGFDTTNIYYNATAGPGSTPTFQLGPRASNPIDANFEFYYAESVGAMHLHNTNATPSPGTLSLNSVPGVAEVNGNALGKLSFAGEIDTSDDITPGADIRGIATQTWTGSVNGAQMSFRTTPNGTSTLTQALLLDQNQVATFAQPPIIPQTGFLYGNNASATTVYGKQGTDTNVLTAGTISGTGATLCTDANGGATTSGCPSSSVSAGQGVSVTSGVLSTTSVTTSQIPFNNQNALTSSMQIAVVPTTFAFTIPTNGTISSSTTERNATSQMYLTALPTATWTATIWKYAAATAGCLTSSGSQIGTAAVATSGAQTWTITSTSFAIGDCFVILAPASVDTSAAGPYGAIAVVD